MQLVTFNSRVSQVQTALDGSAGGLTATDIQEHLRLRVHDVEPDPGTFVTGGDADRALGDEHQLGYLQHVQELGRDRLDGDGPRDVKDAEHQWQWTGSGWLELRPSALQPGHGDVRAPPLNDIKPLAADPANLPCAGARAARRPSVNDPANWIWWGSFGVFSAFPYTSSTTVGTFPR